VRLQPFQVRWLADTSPFKVMNKARRLGASEVACLERALRGSGIEMLPGQAPRIYDPKNVSPNLRNLDLSPVPQNIFSASATQAKDLLARCQPHVFVANEIRGGGLIRDFGKEVVTLNVAGEIIQMRAFSSNSATARSFFGDVLLDEYAHVMRAAKLMAAVKAIAGGTKRRPHGYRLAVVSTPLGDDNEFFEICEGKAAKDEGWSYHKVTIHDAMRDGFVVLDPRTMKPITVEQLRAQYGDAFSQEFECDFVAASQRYIERTLWEAATYDDESDQPEGRGSGVFGGMDIGAGGHESVIVDLERNGDTLWQLAEADRRRERDWDAQERWVADGMKRRSRFAVDASGIGDQFGQRLEQTYPGLAESVKFTLQSKEELATGLKLALARKKLRPMAEDTRLMRDVLSLRRTITAVGNVRYDADETKRAHADGAWALALAVYAAGGATREPYRGAKAKTREPSGIAGPRHKRGEALR
jgi:phage FluMu gp28-like protein